MVTFTLRPIQFTRKKNVDSIYQIGVWMNPIAVLRQCGRENSYLLWEWNSNTSSSYSSVYLLNYYSISA
jgi:hypothetical protein